MTFKYEYQNQGELTLLLVSPQPDWDEFDDFVQLFLTNEAATLISKDTGMDRHQVRYRKAQRQYILQFEHYTNSIWIETDY